MDCQDLEIIKNDIEKFIKQLELKSKNKVIFTDDEKSFLRFLAKHILFLKNYIDLINLNIFWKFSYQIYFHILFQ